VCITKIGVQHNARTREHKGTCLTKCQLGRANHSFCPTIVVLWFCSINTRKLVIVTFFQPNVSCVPNITAIGKFRFIYSLGLDLLPVGLCILETSMSTKLPYQSKKSFPCLDIMAQKLTQLKNYAKNIRTVPRTNARQIGQFRNAGAQLLQHERCPHGKNTTLTSSSMQTLHVFASFS